MSYATRQDIEIAFGTNITDMIVDHGREVVEAAEDDLAKAIADNLPQENIDAAQSALATAQSNMITNVDATIDANLAAGKSIIDSYISSRYPTVWLVVPPLLKTLNASIAVYQMALAADWRTGEMSERYKWALTTLENIRDARQHLTGGDTGEEDGNQMEVEGSFYVGRWQRS